MKDEGLGIRNLGAFNKVLLSKWIWRFLGERNSLWSRIVRSRFGEFKWNKEALVSQNGRERVRDGGRGSWMALEDWNGDGSGGECLKSLETEGMQIFGRVYGLGTGH